MPIKCLLLVRLLQLYSRDYYTTVWNGQLQIHGFRFQLDPQQCDSVTLNVLIGLNTCTYILSPLSLFPTNDNFKPSPSSTSPLSYHLTSYC